MIPKYLTIAMREAKKYSMNKKRTALPVLACTHFKTVRNGRLEIGTTNLGQYFFMTLNAYETPAIDLCVPTKTFYDLLQLLDQNDAASFFQESETKRFLLTGDGFHELAYAIMKFLSKSERGKNNGCS